MPKHHPMDRLHGHLAEVAEHGAQVHAHAHQAAAEHVARTAAERQNDSRETLPPNGS